MNSKLGEIARAITGEILAGDANLTVEGISLDSRKVKQGNLFFALQGEKYDAHDFVVEALSRGAAAAVVSRPVAIKAEIKDRGLIRVSDVRLALQDLARWHRDRFQLHMVAVTGSVGKTTTKDLLAAALGAGFKTLKTEGNHNNEIGVPLTLLQLDTSHQACVAEMAMRNRGEIEQLASIIRPTCAVIINVEPVHLENLGTLQNIAEAKCEVLKFIDRNGFVLINGDNPLLIETAERYPVRKFLFGRDPRCDFRILEAVTLDGGCDIEASMMGEKVKFHIPVPGSHLADNVVAAAGTAFRLGVSIPAIQESLKGFSPSYRRLNIKTGIGGTVVIDDCYNANPVSMQAALKVLNDIAGGRIRVAVLGDMYELGSYEVQGHREVGTRVAELGIEHLLAVGEHARHIWKAAREAGMDEERARYFVDKKSALDYLRTILEEDMVVLIKASRGMQMEEIVEGLE